MWRQRHPALPALPAPAASACASGRAGCRRPQPPPLSRSAAPAAGPPAERGGEGRGTASFETTIPCLASAKSLRARIRSLSNVQYHVVWADGASAPTCCASMFFWLSTTATWLSRRAFCCPSAVHLICSSSMSSERFWRTRRADSRLAMRLQARESVQCTAAQHSMARQRWATRWQEAQHPKGNHLQCTASCATCPAKLRPRTA